MSDFFAANLSFAEIREKTDQFLLDLANRAPVAFRIGQGHLLYDTEGKEYIDFLCGISVTNLGHGEADIIEAVRDQLDRVVHTSNLFYQETQARLAEVLVNYS
ncbi:MAG: aminotransferase class III-fold pyridoxal phosphate-dependent enzyme, partial [Leptospiraceae bacterium]|nr:aminotransferase class III-fold pyridoxal phosphate-dependent enzyme [Leptospiraceae bacterium]